MSREPEERWTVPDGWIWTNLSQLGNVVAGGTPSTKNPSFWGGEVHWISPADLTGYSAKTIQRGAQNISRIGLANSSAKLMPAGSVHFSSRAPIGYIVISSGPLATNQGFKSLVPASGIFNEYVYYYLMASRDFARKRANGTTFLELSGKAFGNLPIPLAPTETQYRIVAKIEELFSDLDKGVENLKKAREQLKVYRQAVLKHAFEGKLTAQWREDNKGEIEGAEQLLARIKQERAAHYERRLEGWKAAVQAWEESGKQGKKPRKPKGCDDRRVERGAGDVSGQPEERWTIPDNWVWTSLSQLGDIVSGGTPSTKNPSFWGDEIRWISPADLTGYSAKTIERGAKGISKTGLAHSAATLMPAGSVHFTSRAPIGHIVISSEPIATNQGFKSLVPATGILNEYVYYYLMASRDFAHKRASGTTFLELSRKAFGNLPIPLAPTGTQRRIVAEIEERFSRADKALEDINIQLDQAQILRQAILKMAFSGQLVPQNPNDELASTLLERIKAEKANEKSSQRGQQAR